MVHKRYLKPIIVVLIIVAIIVVSYLIQRRSSLSIAQPGYYRVTAVYDGDTIEVEMDGVKEKIRLIGVDTPETHHPTKPVGCFGPEASEYTKKALESTIVRLEADEINQNRDRYQRLLRYVYTTDGVLWNERLLSAGYGSALTAFPFTKIDDFKLSEQNAKATSKGMWSACG